MLLLPNELIKQRQFIFFITEVSTRHMDFEPLLPPILVLDYLFLQDYTHFFGSHQCSSSSPQKKDLLLKNDKIPLRSEMHLTTYVITLLVYDCHMTIESSSSLFCPRYSSLPFMWVHSSPFPYVHPE